MFCARLNKRWVSVIAQYYFRVKYTLISGKIKSIAKLINLIYYQRNIEQVLKHKQRKLFITKNSEYILLLKIIKEAEKISTLLRIRIEGHCHLKIYFFSSFQKIVNLKEKWIKTESKLLNSGRKGVSTFFLKLFLKNWRYCPLKCSQEI